MIFIECLLAPMVRHRVVALFPWNCRKSAEYFSHTLLFHEPGTTTFLSMDRVLQSKSISVLQNNDWFDEEITNPYHSVIRMDA